jgi:hypothetical protein
MKKNISLIFIALAILFYGCNKYQFTCKIISPYDSARVLQKNDLYVLVKVKDTKSTVVKVTLTTDKFQFYEITTKPFTFLIPSGSLSLGMHLITAVAENLDGEQARTSIIINVVETLNIEKESPDFVTFANGQKPIGWITYTWEVDNKMGYDDHYSLRSANYPAYVFANKTMKTSGYVEFYSYGDNIEFYIDDEKSYEISSAPDGYWVKRTYEIDSGKHQLKWTAEGVNKYIDAITFGTTEPTKVTTNEKE